MEKWFDGIFVNKRIIKKIASLSYKFQKLIPKIIHYCWFGNLPIPEQQREFIEEWKKLHPDFKFKLWDEKNSPLENDFCRKALEKEKWANLSNYVRFYALYNEGGIYLDTDIKLLKPLHPLLQHECFLGFETDDKDAVVNNAVIGSVRKHSFVDNCIQEFGTKFSGEEQANVSAPLLVTSILKQKYDLQSTCTQELDGVSLFSKDYFYPIHWNETFKLKNYSEYITSNTYCVHLWNKSWFTHDMLSNTISEWQLWAKDLFKENTRLLDLIKEIKSPQIESKHETNELAGLTRTIDQLQNQIVILNDKIDASYKISQDFSQNQKENWKILESHLGNQVEINTLQDKILETFLEDQNQHNQRLNSQITSIQSAVESNKHDLNLLLETLRTVTIRFESEVKIKNNLLEILAKANLEYKSVIETFGDSIKTMQNAFLEKNQLNAKEFERLSNQMISLEDNIKLDKDVAEKRIAIEWYKRTYEQRSLLGLIKQWLFNKFRKE